MREVQVSEITKLVKEHCIRANKILPCDVECRMREACKTESSPLGKEILKDLVTNFEEAKNIDVPICQDTGMAFLFVEYPPPRGVFPLRVPPRTLQTTPSGIFRISVI